MSAELVMAHTVPTTADLVEDGNIHSVERAFALVSLLAREPRLLGVSEIAAELGISRGSTHRVLSTLVNIGYITQDPQTRQYTIDYRVLEIAGFVLGRSELCRQAAPHLHILATATNRSVYLRVPSHGDVVTLQRMGPLYPPHENVEIGARTHASISSVGKVILAAMTEDEVDSFIACYGLRRAGPRSITDPAEFKHALEDIRRLGYAVTDQEIAPAMHSIAAPIRNYAGRVIAGVGVAVYSLSDDWLTAELVSAVIDASRRISFSLGYNAAYIV